MIETLEVNIEREEQKIVECMERVRQWRNMMLELKREADYGY